MGAEVVAGLGGGGGGGGAVASRVLGVVQVLQAVAGQGKGRTLVQVGPWVRVRSVKDGGGAGGRRAGGRAAQRVVQGQREGGQVRVAGVRPPTAELGQWERIQSWTHQGLWEGTLTVVRTEPGHGDLCRSGGRGRAALLPTEASVLFFDGLLGASQPSLALARLLRAAEVRVRLVAIPRVTGRTSIWRADRSVLIPVGCTCRTHQSAVSLWAQKL